MKPSLEQIEAALRASVKETEQLRRQNRDLREASAEPIAIVGMACRLPGGVETPAQLWELLERGGDGVGAFPADRGWDLERIYDPDPERPATSNTREGGFLAAAADFDPGFFGISPREAIGADPQVRLMLEASWEALEDAGVDPTTLHGTPAGVFAGVMYHDYGWGQPPTAEAGRALGTGGSSSVVSGHVAYSLGLKGPAISVDTACSSSLVGIHLAAQALRKGECSLALAGGVTVLSTPSIFIQFSRQGGVAPDGRCKAFAEAADGAGFSEGVGVLVLERLSDAEANGHPILATIKGSAVNQDGASNGLTAPNGPSQERVIRQALANAGLEPKDVEMVEAHGTGTALGDPIEANALLATYGQEREQPLRLGSLKSNIGHAQAAAGVAGVIKAVLAMRAGLMPKTLHVDSPSSHVNWNAGKVELLSESREWKTNGLPRRAAVSSFGATGTNVHMILEEAPGLPSGIDGNAGAPVAGPGASAKEADRDERERALPDGPLPFPLSAKSDAALRAQAARLAARLRDDPALEPLDVAYSLGTTRARLERRAVLLADGREQLLAGLAALEHGEPHAGVLTGTGVGETKVAFLFSGHGSQWPGMALELLESSPAFAGAMAECEEALEPFVGWSMHDVLRGPDEGWLKQIDVLQPILFATMVSLARLWRASGIEPAAVAGHSQGEVSAAYIAGGLSLEDAARLAVVRSRMITELTGQGGGMITIELPLDRLEARIAPWGGKIEIAAMNSPTAAVLAGDRECLGELLRSCEEEGVRARGIPGAVAASHSAQMERLRDDLLAELATISPRSGEIPFYSTVDGEPIDTAGLDGEYWYRNARQPVLFEPVVRKLLERGHRVLIEANFHPVLTSAVRETIEAGPDAALAIGTMRRQEGGAERFTLSLAEALAGGAHLDWPAFLAGSGAKAVPLPTYPFQHKRFWLNAAAGAAGLLEAGLTAADHPLLGAAIDDPEGEGLALSGRLSLDAQPWLADHAAFGTVLLPGTAFVEMALRAGADAGAPVLEELTLETPLVIAADAAALLRVSVAAAEADGRREVAIYSRPEGGGEETTWARHARGVLSAESPTKDGAPSAESWAAEWPPPGAEPIEVEHVYEQLAEAEIEYGPAFQGLVAAWRRGEELYAEVSLPADLAEEARRFGVHPALFDAIGHAGVALSLRDQDALGAGELPMPFAWKGVRLEAVGARTLRVRKSIGDGEEGLTAADENGNRVLSVDSVVARPVDRARLQAASSGGGSLYRLQWRPLSSSANDSPGERVVEDLRTTEKGDPVEVAKALAVRVLKRMQAHLAEADQDARLVILTEGALTTNEAEAPNLAQAALAGLVRSATAEHPGRFCLIDSDGSEASEAAIERALEIDPREAEIALRDGKLLVPRLVQAEEGAGEPTELDPDRTVLITGATGGIGALIAEHLVTTHGARHLLLVSRSGESAPGALDLRARLAEQGAEVEIAACDVSERSQLETLLAGVPKEHPLGAIIHCAAVLDDGLLESMDQERLERVFAPKADAAWHLHELSAGLELTHFVCFSSIAGLLGSPAQANYAAANAFLDGLAAHRRATGLAGSSMAWGGWTVQSEAAAGLDPEQLELLVRRAGERLALLPLSAERGLALFDTALSAPEALTVPAQLDLARLRSRARSGTLPALLEGIVRVPARAAAGGSLARRLAAAPEAEREAIALEVVRGHVAAVLGHDSAAEVDPEKAFKDLGFDSLAAVELRNRLAADSGASLAPTVGFDYPNPLALARHLLALSAGEGAGQRVLAARAAYEEPIAIVGMACRFPGGVSSPQQLWELLARGGDAISAFPDDRGWDLERLYDPEPGQAGKSYVNQGGFLRDAADFDPGFFDISPREALEMDPQQRLMLELSWEVLEDAGIDPRALRGSPTGVFAGSMYQDYGEVAGMSSSAVSGRISYTLGLEGPSLSVDTACSSSLVAMHLAAGALRGGECSLALAGGVAVLSTPTVFVEFSRQLGLAADGRSKAFAAAADGVGVSEGVGVLVLERLADAEANGHRILATIKGSAVNQDGASNGLTAPNGPSQERVIRQALANAGLEPKDVEMVEAHGTGTALGDPIEANALLATYGQERETPLRLGSLKSNIGHAQAAAGVAGVIKAVLAMREGTMPKTLHLDEPSPNVDWEAGKIELLGEPFEWEPNGHPRRAGVSSFGASGTNAHLILEAPEPATQADSSPDGGPEAPAAAPRPLPGWAPLPLSARTEPALRAAAAELAATVRADESLAIADVACSLAMRKPRFERRAVIAQRDRTGVLACLDALARGEEHPAVATGLAREERKPVFLFGGQGAQWAGMGMELSEASPRFAASMRACEEALAPHVDWSLDAVLRDPEGAWLERLDVVQPALFALMVSLADLWRSLGVQPAAVVGHSQGEIAAAHVAGALSLEDAALIVAHRARAMTEIAGAGGMLWLSAPVDWLDARLEDFDGRISLAAINGPTSLVVSGEPAALAELAESCRGEGRETRPVAVDYAAHSAQVDALEAELLEAFAPISPRSGEIPFHSTVTAAPLDGVELGPAYWFRNLRQTVRFDPVLRSLLERGSRAFVEVAPHPVLAYGAEETIADALGGAEGAAVFGALRRDDGGAPRFALSLAEATAHGVRIDWKQLFTDEAGAPVSLPTYPFQRRRFWPDSLASSSDPRSLGQESADHPFLGAELSLAADGGRIFTGRLSRESQRWLLDHRVEGVAAVPASVWLELALTAAAAVDCELVEELELSGQVALAETGAAQLQVRVGAEDDAGARALSIHWRGEASAEDEEKWRPAARASLRRAAVEEAAAATASWPAPGAESFDPESLLDQLAARGLELGESFQCLRRAWREGASLLLELALDEEQTASGYSLHPALLQTALLCACANEGSAPLELPATVGRASVRCGDELTTLRVTITPGDEGTSLLLADDEGRPLGELSGVQGRPLERGDLAGARAEESLFGLEWHELERPQAGYDEGLALLGDLDLDGLAAERHPDLESLLAAGTAPALVIADCAAAEANSDSPPAAAEEGAGRVLELLRRWVAEPGLVDSRLALITHGAQATIEGEDADPAAAALWGLVRSAQAEHPGRFSLIDLGAGEAPGPALAAALAVAAEESQLALRDGALRVPRLAPIAPDSTAEKFEVDAERTVLVCDGGEQLGSLIASHLVSSYGVRHLVLAYPSEGGVEPDPDLRARLEALGAEVRIEPWDPVDREQVRGLIESIDSEHPLGTVVHAARVLEDGVLESLDRDRLERALGQRAHGAWHLHELTRELDLSRFLLISDASGTLGLAAQANYAAANAFLDALAAHRHAQGLPAMALAWGPIEAADGDREMTDAVRARLRRAGLLPLQRERALELLDRALLVDRPFVAPIELDRGALRARAREGGLAAVLRALAPTSRRVRTARATLTERLLAAPEEERAAIALEELRGHVATVLGHGSGGDVDPERPFQELGFDSLAAVELRNRLAAATGTSLPPTLVFDYPTPAALAGYLAAQCGEGDAGTAEDAVEAALAGLTEALARLGDGGGARERVGMRLRAAVAGISGEESERDEVLAVDLAAMSDDEVFALIDEEAGDG